MVLILGLLSCLCRSYLLYRKVYVRTTDYKKISTFIMLIECYISLFQIPTLV